MGLIHIFEFVIIMIELFIVFITYFHSIGRYKKIMNRYNSINDTKDKEYITIRKFNPTKSIIKSNMTEEIDVKKLEQDLHLPILIFYINNITVQTITLTQETTFIGRGKSDDIEIDEPTISRSQCFITKEEEEYFINIDILRKPIFLNGDIIQNDRVKLYDGDVITMGNGKISFLFVMSTDMTTPLRA